MERDDIEALIARVALGDRDAFSRLYDATSGKLFSICFRILKQRAIAEDSMQDVYVKIWKNADRYQVTGHSPMTWLITIARNTSIDRLRRQPRTEDLDSVGDRLAAPGPSPEQSAVAASEARRITACLDELHPAHRDAVTAAYLDGESYKDLSTRLDVPLNTIRTWLRRGLISLKECMSR